jgi:hypothetical protein
VFGAEIADSFANAVTGSNGGSRLEIVNVVFVVGVLWKSLRVCFDYHSWILLTAYLNGDISALSMAAVEINGFQNKLAQPNLNPRRSTASNR